MNITVKVIPRARQTKIVAEQDKLKIYVHEPAVDGKANKAVIKSIAEYYNVKKSAVTILKGEMSRDKIIRAG